MPINGGANVTEVAAAAAAVVDYSTNVQRIVLDAHSHFRPWA